MGWRLRGFLRGESGPNQTTPLIAVTASAFASDREACLAAGMDEHIAKPLNFKLLLDRLNIMTKKDQLEIQTAATKIGLYSAAPPITHEKPMIDFSGLHQLRDIMGDKKFAEILGHFRGVGKCVARGCFWRR